jgi:hypothetical protein
VSTAIEWGSTADERGASYPCEEFVPDADIAVFRAIDISAPVAVVFRWLCQLRVAPYSYDLLDNLGRRSPRSGWRRGRWQTRARRQRRQLTGAQTPVLAATRPEAAASRSAL